MSQVTLYLQSMGPFQIIGLMGFLVYLLSFAWVQIGSLDGNSVCYSLLNVLAASLVAVSLVVEFNLASALIQASWILVGLVGSVKRLFSRCAAPTRPVPSREML